MPFNEQLPEWEAEGTQPPASKRVEGWQPSEKPPASWFNWLLNRTYKVLQELQQKALHKDDIQASDIPTDDNSTVQEKLDDHESQIQTAQQTADMAMDVANTAQQTANNHASRHAQGGPDEITSEMIGAETPAGAQAKADQAETNAKNYTDQQIANIEVPVTSVNGKTGDVNLTAADVGAASQGDFATHLADDMPHQFTDGTKTYKWGLKVINGVVNMIYEEV